MRQIYGVVIFDSSPLLTVADTSILASAIDGIVLVARISVTRPYEAERAVELLRTQGSPVLGSVINGVTREQIGYGYGTNGAVRPAKGDRYSISGPQAEPTNGTIDHPAVG
jgi:Mrp family chromosome partitioning ATPase